MRTALLFLLTLSVTMALPPGIAERSLQLRTGADDSPIDSRNNVIELFLLGKLEEVRETMLHGNEDVPVLDPLHEEHVHLDLTDLLGEIIEVPFAGEISIVNMILNNLSTFVVEQLSFNMFTQVLRFNVYVPVLELLGDNYDLNLFIDGITATGNGALSARVLNGRLRGSARAIPTIIGGIGVNVQDINIVLKMDAFEPKIENLLGTGAESDLANAVLGDMLPVLCDFFEEEISAVLNRIAMEIINDLL